MDQQDPRYRINFFSFYSYTQKALRHQDPGLVAASEPDFGPVLDRGCFCNYTSHLWYPYTAFGIPFTPGNLSHDPATKCVPAFQRLWEEKHLNFTNSSCPSRTEGCQYPVTETNITLLHRLIPQDLKAWLSNGYIKQVDEGEPGVAQIPFECFNSTLPGNATNSTQGS
ncbi:MAG: hypothetical protein M1836_007905 [Candelina mexicana]|nr:MAG: hypothetical protein M1836_007905 [Candelina mexicana]